MKSNNGYKAIVRDDIYEILTSYVSKNEAKAILADFDLVYENLPTEEEVYDYFTSQV